jgi:DNA-directed RNA polymerase specialized sigma24 family protein
MPRTREQLEAAAVEAEAWLDQLDPDVTPAEDVSDLRAVTDAMRAVAGAQAELDRAVLAARAAGRSWGVIAIALGTSRQAVRQRYEQMVTR